MKWRLLADENVDPALVLGLQRRVCAVDIVRVQEVGLRTLDDRVILQWAADHYRVLISKDVSTLPTFAYERIAAGATMPGVFILPPKISIAAVIDDLALVVSVTEPEEWISRVVYLPFQ